MAKNWPMWLGLALGMGALATGLALGDTAEQQWSAATRFTARVGFPLLILAYLARPLVDLTRSGWAKSLLGYRKWIGLGFAFSHTLHLGAIVVLLRIQGELPAVATLVFGGLAYLLLYAMAFTSNRAAMQALGANWKRLHRFGIHYLWFIFAQSYVGRIFEPGKMEEGVLFGGIAILAASVRFAAWLKQKRKRQPTS